VSALRIDGYRIDQSAKRSLSFTRIWDYNFERLKIGDECKQRDITRVCRRT
jgi:hypothetical protein